MAALMNVIYGQDVWLLFCFLYQLDYPSDRQISSKKYEYKNLDIFIFTTLHIFRLFIVKIIH